MSPHKVRREALKYGYRSGLEHKISMASDRRKHLAIKKQHPKLDIRFVFTNSKAKLSKGAKSNYAEWCIKYGFRYYDRIIPEDWLKEKGKNKHPKFIKFIGTKVRRK